MKRVALSFILLLCLLLPASLGSCSARYTVTEERLRTQKTAWQIVSGSLLLAFLF